MIISNETFDRETINGAVDYIAEDIAISLLNDAIRFLETGEKFFNAIIGEEMIDMCDKYNFMRDYLGCIRVEAEHLQETVRDLILYHELDSDPELIKYMKTVIANLKEMDANMDSMRDGTFKG